MSFFNGFHDVRFLIDECFKSELVGVASSAFPVVPVGGSGVQEMSFFNGFHDVRFLMIYIFIL